MVSLLNSAICSSSLIIALVLNNVYMEAEISTSGHTHARDGITLGYVVFVSMWKLFLCLLAKVRVAFSFV